MVAGHAAFDYGLGVFQPDRDPAIVQGKRMAKRNQLRGFLGGHDAGDDGRLENRALFAENVPVLELGQDFRGQAHYGPGRGLAAGDVFAADIHHGGLVVSIEMREHRPGSWGHRLGASGIKIKISQRLAPGGWVITTIWGFAGQGYPLGYPSEIIPMYRPTFRFHMVNGT